MTRREVGRLLGCPADSVGRRLRMAPVRLREDWTVAVGLENLRDHGGREQAAIVSVPVVSPQARLTGVGEIMREPVSAVVGGRPSRWGTRPASARAPATAAGADAEPHTVWRVRGAG